MAGSARRTVAPRRRPRRRAPPVSVGARTVDRPVDRHQSACLPVLAARRRGLGASAATVSRSRCAARRGKSLRRPDGDMVVAAPGSQALIQIIPRLIETCEVAVLGPTYAEHAAAWARCGHEGERDRLARGHGRCARARRRQSRTIRPAASWPPSALRRSRAVGAARRAARRRRGICRFRQLQASALFRNCRRLRSCFAHLAKPTDWPAALGFCRGTRGAREARADWSSDLGPCRGRRSLSARRPWPIRRWLEDTRDKLNEGCQRLDELLAASGFKLEGGTHLFRLASHARAHDIADALGRDGIHVRRFEAHPHWLRFGLPNSSDAWQRLELPMRNSTSRLSP